MWRHTAFNSFFFLLHHTSSQYREPPSPIDFWVFTVAAAATRLMLRNASKTKWPLSLFVYSSRLARYTFLTYRRGVYKIILRTDWQTTDLCSWKSLPWRTSNGHISITKLDRRMVTIDHRWEVDPRESNGHETDGVICGVKRKELKSS